MALQAQSAGLFRANQILERFRPGIAVQTTRARMEFAKINLKIALRESGPARARFFIQTGQGGEDWESPVLHLFHSCCFIQSRPSSEFRNRQTGTFRMRLREPRRSSCLDTMIT